MTRPLAEGIYEHLVTEGIERDLAGLRPEIRRAIELLGEADGHLALARHLGQEVALVLGSVPQKERLEVGRESTDIHSSAGRSCQAGLSSR